MPSFELVDDANGSFVLFDPSTDVVVVNAEKPIIPPTYGMMVGPGTPSCPPIDPPKIALVVVTSTLMSPSAPPPSGTRRRSEP